MLRYCDLPPPLQPLGLPVAGRMRVSMQYPTFSPPLKQLPDRHVNEVLQIQAQLPICLLPRERPYDQPADSLKPLKGPPVFYPAITISKSARRASVKTKLDRGTRAFNGGQDKFPIIALRRGRIARLTVIKKTTFTC